MPPPMRAGDIEATGWPASRVTARADGAALRLTITLFMYFTLADAAC